MTADEFYSLAIELDELKIAPEQIEELNEETLAYLSELADRKEEFKRYNRLAYFKPYPYQLKYYSAGKNYRQRYLSCSNRVGKSYGMAAEFAMHITGLYAPWWDGKVFEDGGEIFWCIGITQDSTNGVLMQELLGVSDCRNLHDIGTGSIPKDCIILDSMVKDGERIKSVRIKHVSGKENILHFFAATQGPMVLAGRTVGGMIWIDEQPDNEMEIYDQARTRTMTTEGHIAITATPEKGASDLWKTFHEDETGKLYFQTATWWDAHEDYVEGGHITDEMIEEQRASCSPRKFEMRSKGIPVMGSGSVYDFPQSKIDTELTIADIMESPSNYKMIWGCDFGYVSSLEADPSTLILCAYDKSSDVIHVIKEWNSRADLKIDPLANMPSYMASIIKSSGFPNAPLIVPHDGTKGIEGTNTTRLAEFRRLGINVLPEVFSIPYQLHNGVLGSPKNPRSLDWTINYCQINFHKDKLKINTRHLPELMKEYDLYHYNSNGNGKPVDKYNHHLDAMRYAVVSVKHKGWEVFKCLSTPINKWASSREVNQRLKSLNRF